MIRTILAAVLFATSISGCYANAAQENVTSEVTEGVPEASEQCGTAESQESGPSFPQCKRCVKWCRDGSKKTFSQCINLCKSLNRCP
jgi:hypothetical protein